MAETNKQNKTKPKKVAVWFTTNDVTELKKFTSMKFNLFVKSSYYEKIDRTKLQTQKIKG